MKIHPVNQKPVVEPIKKGKDTSSKEEIKKEDSQNPVQYETSETKKAATYEKPDKATILRLQKQSEEAYANLRGLVEKLLLKQGYTLKTITAEEWQQVEIDDATRTEAQNMIAPGGAFSPEAVSDRILEFAKAISNGDISKLETLRGAIEEGFKQAEAILGELPEISKETYRLIQEKLDSWSKETL